MRHLTLSLAACIAVSLGSAVAIAQPATTPAANTPRTQAGAPLDRNAQNTVICKKLAPETGSRIGPRMACLTNRQWDEAHREAQYGYDQQVKKSVAWGH
ncbi:MAG TPA: hypothetical protein VIM56_15685 [Rhizomicrobium sp.]